MRLAEKLYSVATIIFCTHANHQDKWCAVLTRGEYLTEANGLTLLLSMTSWADHLTIQELASANDATEKCKDSTK